MEAQNPYRTKQRPNNSYATIYERGFKAGYKQAKEDMDIQLVSLAELCLNHRKQGIKEAVEWLTDNCVISILDKDLVFARTGSITFQIGNLKGSEEWQAKLKEWGL